MLTRLYYISAKMFPETFPRLLNSTLAKYRNPFQFCTYYFIMGLFLSCRASSAPVGRFELDNAKARYGEKKGPLFIFTSPLFYHKPNQYNWLRHIRESIINESQYPARPNQAAGYYSMAIVSEMLKPWPWYTGDHCLGIFTSVRPSDDNLIVRYVMMTFHQV